MRNNIVELLENIIKNSSKITINTSAENCKDILTNELEIFDIDRLFQVINAGKI
ncbi:hypothetical protein IC006_0154 [Sulfuracidifex tepidarius]|uniref:Uncharacterized protein n=1 Tax=Sulfuracidifex tepidarius TaxID=1294262 RepID=A0A510DRV1_9CREN|nr:hypothetical protein IC006_0154 [Sulfuracidifex tepidarius]BBG25631.1 hypothetical protein IC007_0136 [Sulfuracidifex tepidarius]